MAAQKKQKEQKEQKIYEVGKNYFIRTVTNFILGRMEVVTPTELVLSTASWVADTERWYDTLETGALREVEPYPDNVIVGRGSIVDATVWRHELPTQQK